VALVALQPQQVRQVLLRQALVRLVLLRQVLLVRLQSALLVQQLERSGSIPVVPDPVLVRLVPALAVPAPPELSAEPGLG
jgi:hypothetical protein